MGLHPIDAAKSVGMVAAGEPLVTAYETFKGALGTVADLPLGALHETGHLATVLTLGFYSYDNEGWLKAVGMSCGGELLCTAGNIVKDAAGTVWQPVAGVGRELQYAGSAVTLGIYDGPWEPTKKSNG